jgi:hypothetical protein
VVSGPDIDARDTALSHVSEHRDAAVGGASPPARGYRAGMA